MILQKSFYSGNAGWEWKIKREEMDHRVFGVDSLNSRIFSRVSR
jgi:hypothetical protein